MTKPRNFRADHSHLVVHATRDGKLIFEEQSVAEAAVAELKRLSVREGLPVLAYCFLRDKMLLLFGSLQDPTVISGFMKLLTHYITGAHNRHYDIQGTLWRERFQVWPVRSGSTELTVMRYIDRLPVGEERVRSVNLYSFSSYAQRTSHDANFSWLGWPGAFLQRYLTHERCLAEYCEFVKIGPNQSDVSMVEAAMRHEENTIGEGDYGALPEKLPDKTVDRKPDDDPDSPDDLQYE